MGYTHRDLEIWTEVVAQALLWLGLISDTIQVAYGYGPFTGGLGLHYGAEKVGATVIPISTGNTRKQLQFMTDFHATVIACTPSYAAHLGESILKEGISPEKVKLRVGVFGAEPWTNEMRAQIENLLIYKAYDIYGLSEIIGRECPWNVNVNKGTTFSKTILSRDYRSETLETLPYGEVGELVFTTVTKEAMPLLRYRTRDLTRLFIDYVRLWPYVL